MDNTGKKNNFLAGVVGCGQIGSLYDEKKRRQEVYTHAGMYQVTPGINLACGADIDHERLKTFGRHWGCSALFNNVQTMLEKCPVDILSITTPDTSHEEIIRTAIHAKNPPRIILVEKPLATSAKAGERLLAEAEDADIVLLVNYVRRWDQMHRKIKDLLQSGKLGTINWVTGYFVRGLRHNGCNLINLLRFLLGEIERLETIGATDRGSLEGDPSPNVHVLFQNKAEGLLVGLDQKGYDFSIFDLDIFTSKGRLKVTANGTRAELYHARQDPKFTNFKTLASPSILESTYETAMREAGLELVKLLSNPSLVPENNAHEAIKDLKYIEELICTSAA